MQSTHIQGLTAAITGSALFFAAATHAQNLNERINHVMQKRAAAESQNTSKARMLGAMLFTDVTVQFQDTSARDAINYLQTVLGVNLVARYSDDKTGEGLDPETPITLNVSNKPALTVLEMVLDQAAGDEEATWQLRDGYVEVGTKDRLSSGSAREIRYYPISDLLFSPPQFNNAPQVDLNNALNQSQNSGGQGGGQGGGTGGGGGGGGGQGGQQGNIFGQAGAEDPRLSEAERAQQIIDLIVETVEPDGWDITGGTWATIRYYQGTLIIRAPDFIHRQIGGYPFSIRPVNSAQVSKGGGRYVMFSGGVSDVQVTGVTTATFTGSAGGTGTSGSTGGGTPNP